MRSRDGARYREACEACHDLPRGKAPERRSGIVHLIQTVLWIDRLVFHKDIGIEL
jgi:hypothetical protein